MAGPSSAKCFSHSPGHPAEGSRMCAVCHDGASQAVTVDPGSADVGVTVRIKRNSSQDLLRESLEQ